MASPLVSRTPQCLSCIRRMSGVGESFRLPSNQQTRGKKKVAKATTIYVKLSANIVGFGKKGSIVPVPPGTMRNTWFPKKMAEYQTHAQLKELGDMVIEIDPALNSGDGETVAQVRREAPKAEPLMPPETQEAFEEVVSFEPEAPIEEPEFLLSPTQATTIVSKLIPTNLEFYRKATPMPAQSAPLPSKKLSPSLASTSAIAAAAAAAAIEKAEQGAQTPMRTAFNGSISTADITATLEAILSEDIEGSQVVLSPENISFADESSLKDKTRVKHLGSYAIDIKLGPSETERVRRTITINAKQ